MKLLPVAPVSSPPPAARRMVRAHVLLAACVALLLAQALALLHPVMHGHGPAVPTGAGEVHAHAHAQGDDGSTWLAALLPQHDDASDCILFDGLAPQPFALPAPASVAPVLAPATVKLLRAAAGEVRARWALLFDARGPPPAA